MSVRICTIDVPRFSHGKVVREERPDPTDPRKRVTVIVSDVLEVGTTWTDVGKPSDRQRAALRDFHGRFIKVHPDDLTNLSALGLRFVDETSPLEEIPKSKPRPAAAAEPKTAATEPTK
jgi:hypothetical protein